MGLKVVETSVARIRSSTSRISCATSMRVRRAASPSRHRHIVRYFIAFLVASDGLLTCYLSRRISSRLQTQYPTPPDADIVCSRAKTHYNPGVDMSAASETASTTAGQAAEQNLANQFRQVHPTQKNRMYFQ